MATSTRTRKSKAAVENVAVEEVTSAAASTAKAKTKRKFAPDDPIVCKSVTYGELILMGTKSKLGYTWANIGDTTEVEYQDLQALYSVHSRFLTEPYFVIEDEDLCEQWKNLLEPIYSKMKTEDMEALLKMTPSQIKSALKDAPEGYQQSVKSLAAAKILDGSFDSANKIKAIDEVLGTELLSMLQ